MSVPLTTWIADAGQCINTQLYCESNWNHTMQGHEGAS